MRNNNQMLLIGLGLIVILGLALGYSAKLNYEGSERARSLAIVNEIANQLHEGMNSEAVEPLVKGAWRQYDCAGDQLYFFGNHDPGLASNLLLNYIVRDGHVVLTKVSSIENYWQSEYTSICKLSK